MHRWKSSWALVGAMVVAASCGHEEPGEGEALLQSAAQEADPECSAGPKTAYPGGRWTVPEATYGTVIEKDIRITMSDGVVLVGDVSYPADLATGQRAAGKFPVLLTQNPYGGTFGPASGRLFVTHGYIFASVDVRGTSRSKGVHDMFGPREAEDGAELVKWAAALQGSDGRVGLTGCSQLGINQLETVTKLGPDSPVKAMIPACGSGDFYRDTAFDNGIPTLVGALLVGALPPAQQADAYLYRDYWKTRDRVARVEAMYQTGVPMLFWSGWHEPGALGSLELYAALQNLSAGRPAYAKVEPGQKLSGKYQVILGDWGHAGGLDQGIQLQWYDTWIKGVDTGLPKETATPLHLGELGGTKRWVNASSYPLTSRYTALYLSSGGKLTRQAEASAGTDKFTWVAPGRASAFVDYTTEPFADGAVVAGPIAAHLEATSSNTDLQMVVEVFDKAPGGALKRISRGSILGSLRRTDAEASWTDDEGLPARPRLTLDEPQPLTAGQPNRLEFPLWPTLWSVEKGHSIVVRISTQSSSLECVNALGVPVGCSPTVPMQAALAGGTYTLHRGGELESFISLPLLAHGALATSPSKASPTGAAGTPLPIDW